MNQLTANILEIMAQGEKSVSYIIYGDKIHFKIVFLNANL